jgi:hypothetical protein
LSINLQSAGETADFAECADNQSVSQPYVFTSQVRTPPTESFFAKIDFLWVIYPEAAVLVRKGKVGVLDEAVHEANQFAHDGD